MKIKTNKDMHPDKCKDCDYRNARLHCGEWVCADCSVRGTKLSPKDTQTKPIVTRITISKADIEQRQKETELRRREIVNALKVIKDTCNANSDCSECPLRGKLSCGLIETTPKYWDINTPDEWKAF